MDPKVSNSGISYINNTLSIKVKTVEYFHIDATPSKIGNFFFFLKRQPFLEIGRLSIFENKHLIKRQDAN